MAWSREQIAKEYKPWQIQQDESLVDYYKRLAELRKGGILGTMGMMDTPKKEKEGKLEATSDAPLGEEVVNESTQEVYDPYTGSDWESGGYSRKDQEVGDALDRLTGRKYAGQGLMYGIPNLLSNWSDRSKVESQLRAQGWTDEQIAQYMDTAFGVEALKATQSLDRLGVMSKDPYDYKEQGTQDSLFDVGKSVVGSLFGLDKEQSRQSPFRPASDWDMPLVTPKAGMWANIAAAQERTPFDPFSGITGNLFDQQQKWVDVSAQNLAAEEAARQAEIARQAEAARVAAANAATAEAAKAAGVVDDYYDYIPSSGSDSNGNGYTGSTGWGGGWSGVESGGTATASDFGDDYY